MTRADDDVRDEISDGGEAQTTGLNFAKEAVPAAVAHNGPLQALVIGADRALLGLLSEWLAACDCRVIEAGAGEKAMDFPFHFIIVDVPFPRQGGLHMLRRVAHTYPDAPILALSSNFFPGIDGAGAVAKTLGVAGALAMPISRDALLAAVRDLLSKKP